MAVQLKKSEEFLNAILEKLPEHERAAARTMYSQAQDELSTVARGLDTSIQQVNETAGKQAAWYTQHKDVIEGRRTDNVITTAVDGEALKKEFGSALNRAREEAATQILYLGGIMPTLIAQHQAEFGGEVLDGAKLLKDAGESGLDLPTYYSQSVAERRRAALATKSAADITAAEERGRLVGLKEAGNGHVPYPVNGHGRAPTTLDGLRKPAEGQASTGGLDAAIATATEMMQRQQ